MMNGGMFNIDNQVEPTNKDITVVFSPSNNTVKYSYSIYKSGKKSVQLIRMEINRLKLIWMIVVIIKFR